MLPQYLKNILVQLDNFFESKIKSSFKFLSSYIILFLIVLCFNNQV